MLTLRRLLLALTCLVLGGCFPMQAPERLPVYTLVSEAQKAEGRFHLDLLSTGLTAFPEGLAGLPGMARLSLRGNTLGYVGAEIGELRELPWLDLGEAGVSGLDPAIGGMKKLETLYLGDNVMEALPPSIGELSALRYLNLDRNRLRSLPTEIGNLEQLRWLRVNQNALTELPESITQLKSLERLYLRNNQLTALPSGIGSLTGLKALLLEGNSFPEEEKQRIGKALPSCNVSF